jgi:hypothetical protein
VAFDTDLSLLPETEAAIRQKVQEEVDNKFPAGNAPAVVLQTVPWLGGAVKLVLQQDGKRIKSIYGATSPSLTGNNTAVFFMELDLVATAIFKDTLSKGASSAIQVIYDLDHYVRLPKATARGTWHASAFYSFFQDVDIEESFWGEDSYTEITSSTRYSNEVTETEFLPVEDPNMTPDERREFDEWVRELITKQLEEGVKRNLLQTVADVNPDVTAWTDGEDLENVRRTVNNTQISDVRVEWTEAKAIIRQIHPQGSLPTVTSLKGPDGAPLRWEDYYSNISVDEFLRTLLVSIRVGAAFEDYGISLVEVRVRYPHGEFAKTVDATFTKDNLDTPQKAEFIVADKIRRYFWSYTVHFEGDVPEWTSEEVEDEGQDLNIKLSNLPVLKLDVVNGDINFEQVARARVRVRYDGGVSPIERFFNLTPTDAPGGQRLLEVVGKPRTGLVSYQTTYTMKGDGREITGPLLTTDADVISIDDPFRALKTVTFQAVGDLDNDIKDVTVQATYEEPANGFRQDFSVTLSGEGKTFDTWTFPTIDENKGTLSYQASIRRRNGTTRDVQENPARGTRFEIGEKFGDKLDVRIIASLVDWTKVKLVNVSLRYDGSTPPKTDDFLFEPADAATKTWTVPLTDPSRTSYTVTVTYFLVDGSRRTVGPEEATGESVFLELPA